MIKYHNIKENILYSYYTSDEKMYYFFEYRDNSTLGVTSFDYYIKSNELIYEKFQEYYHKFKFDTSVYSQGSECKDLNDLIKILFESHFKWLS